MKARLVSVLASMTLTATALSVAAPAQADPVPPEQMMVVTDQFPMGNSMGNFVVSAQITFAAPNGSIPPGTYGDFTFSSCGQVVQSRRYDLTNPGYGTRGISHNFTDDGNFSFFENEYNRKIGRTLEWSATIAQPGYDPYVVASSMPAGVPRPSCDVILTNSGGTSPSDIVVQSWSAKKGPRTARVGKRLAVTPTRAPGAKVAYAWLVGTTIRDRDRTQTVKKSFRGEKVALRITVSKPGVKSVSKWLRYGTTRD